MIQSVISGHYCFKEQNKAEQRFVSWKSTVRSMLNSAIDSVSLHEFDVTLKDFHHKTKTTADFKIVLTTYSDILVLWFEVSRERSFFVSHTFKT